MFNRKLCDLKEVFVAFKAARLPFAKQVFFNSDFGGSCFAETIERKYGYIVQAESLREISDLDSKIFQAERYGGDGILRNGGGGRCGFDGMYQVKGIGANQLVGKNVEIAHSNGMLSLDLAIHEAIWGEIVSLALPFGAVRTVAILDTMTDFDMGDETHMRGLLIRESVVRPAHFIRALHFKVPKDTDLPKDARRVEAAIKRLVEFLPYEEDVSGMDLSAQLMNGMVELSRRFAIQFAAARAKRIYHNNVSASNVSIEGGWLDLSGTQIFFDSQLYDRLDYERFTFEFVPAMESIKEMCFYSVKYAGIPLEDGARIYNAAVIEFHESYRRELNRQRLAQVGIPGYLFNELENTDAFQVFFCCLDKIFEKDRLMLIPVCKSAKWRGNDVWVASIFRGLLRAVVREGVANDYFEKIQDDDLSEEIERSYRQVFDLTCEYASTQGISRESLILAMCINSVRLTRVPELLKFSAMKEEISGITSMLRADERDKSISDLVERMKSLTCLNLVVDGSMKVNFFKTQWLSIKFDLASGEFLVSENACETRCSLADLVSMGAGQIGIAEAIDFYTDIWDVIDEI